MRKFFIIFFYALVGLIMGAIFFSLFATYSIGDRAGKVVKFSKKGVAIKTWEGQLFTGGMAGSGDGDMASPHWEFSVYKGDDEVLKAITDAMDQGYRVKLRYEEMYFQFDWRGDTKYFVTDVEKIE